MERELRLNNLNISIRIWPLIGDFAAPSLAAVALKGPIVYPQADLEDPNLLRNSFRQLGKSKPPTKQLIRKHEKPMKHIFTGFNLIGAIALLALALGCANTQQTENLLSAAGFRTIVANTPERQQHLKTLPPDKVTLVQRNGKNYYVYADPAHWQIFVGNPSQYQKYQQLRLANNMAQDQLEAAQMNSLNWGMWGPWY
jgi:hypothetical protein